MKIPSKEGELKRLLQELQPLQDLEHGIMQHRQLVGLAEEHLLRL